MARNVFVLMIILGLVGTSGIDMYSKNWKTAIIGILYAAATAIIFWWKE